MNLSIYNSYKYKQDTMICNEYVHLLLLQFELYQECKII